jgi:hypothetical protein
LVLGAATESGKAIWVCEQEHGASAIRIERATIERQACPTGEVGGTGAQPTNGTLVSEVVPVCSRNHAYAQRKVGRHVVGVPAKNIAFIDQRSNCASQWTLIDGDHSG